MKAFIDPEKCVGCGACVEACPEVFKMEEGKAVVYSGTVPQDAEEKCEQALEVCGPNAIRIE